MKRETEWTEIGHRVTLEVVSERFVVLTCQTKVFYLEDPSTPKRMLWVRSQLALPHATPSPDAARLVSHWLAFYGDAQLSVLGITMFRDVFDSFEERVEAPPRASPGGDTGGVLH
jgi:hypothetical protein